ncbi:hypothetical protein [Moraxella lacunata]
MMTLSIKPALFVFSKIGKSHVFKKLLACHQMGYYGIYTLQNEKVPRFP